MKSVKCYNILYSFLIELFGGESSNGSEFYAGVHSIHISGVFIS